MQLVGAGVDCSGLGHETLVLSINMRLPIMLVLTILAVGLFKHC